MKAARICTGAISIGLPLLFALTGGCQHKADGVPTSSSAMDLSANPAFTPAPAYTPAPVAAQPVYDSAPVVASAISPASSANTTAFGGGSYVVKKGDTLYGIARKTYGDGKQWQKIVAANPGVSPSTLKVGQTLTLP